MKGAENFHIHSCALLSSTNYSHLHLFHNLFWFYIVCWRNCISAFHCNVLQNILWHPEINSWTNFSVFLPYNFLSLWFFIIRIASIDGWNNFKTPMADNVQIQRGTGVLASMPCLIIHWFLTMWRCRSTGRWWSRLHSGGGVGLFIEKECQEKY